MQYLEYNTRKKERVQKDRKDGFVIEVSHAIMQLCDLQLIASSAKISSQSKRFHISLLLNIDTIEKKIKSFVFVAFYFPNSQIHTFFVSESIIALIVNTHSLASETFITALGLLVCACK
jgi:hypothetical protein